MLLIQATNHLCHADHLQLLAVRFVDPGHPEEKTGPRYRVWFRNNSDLAIDKPFDVKNVYTNEFLDRSIRMSK